MMERPAGSGLVEADGGERPSIAPQFAPSLSGRKRRFINELLAARGAGYPGGGVTGAPGHNAARAVLSGHRWSSIIRPLNHPARDWELICNRTLIGRSRDQTAPSHECVAGTEIS